MFSTVDDLSHVPMRWFFDGYGTTRSIIFWLQSTVVFDAPVTEVRRVPDVLRPDDQPTYMVRATTIAQDDASAASERRGGINACSACV
jgi:hypothetical protein